MSSISQIILKNIKFFHDETIQISKNVLFYGENGSGKSSLYWALKVHFEYLTNIINDEEKEMFFNQENPKNLLNRNYLHEEHSVVIAPHDLILSKDTIHFINHQLLAKLFSFDIDGTANFFNVLSDDLMSKYSLFAELKEIVFNVTSNAQNNDIQDIERNIVLYQEKLALILQNVEDKANIIISENFDESLFQITLSIVENPSSKDTYLGYYKIEDPKIILQVNHISNPQHHFNEAKLKLISLAIYFAIIELSKPENYNGLRLAVFDDFLQSLDMSYRDVVLDYIFQNFQDYQIFMLTHDLMFYKLLKRKAKFYEKEADWEYKNIYIRETITEETASIEPKIYDNSNGSDDYIRKARRALLENDFETCGNNCRKELERTIVNLTVELQVGTKTQLQRFLDLYLKNDLEYTQYYFEPQKVIKALLSGEVEIDTFKKVDLVQLRECLGKSEFYKDIVLNPSSHDQEGEHYKREFDSIIKNIEELKEIITPTNRGNR